MSGDTTFGADGGPASIQATETPRIFALAIAWCARDPSRVGEIAVVARSGLPLVLGRGQGDGPTARLRFFRQRPGVMAPTPPLDGAGLSRRQLVLRAREDAIELERVGQCRVRVNGAESDSALLRDGDVVYVRRELLLCVVLRPPIVPTARHFRSGADHAFGEADRLGIVGESAAAYRLRESVAFAAKANVHTLVVGESGTGKELAARAIHVLSPRSKRAFVARNAATLPAGLVDAELFGNLRNYPNPGMPERPGLIGEADGGTLFLDEIAELPQELQARLLRVLDAGGEYQRLGDSSPRRSDFRLVGATNRDPSALKHDVLARFALRVAVPSLAERREDVPLLLRSLALRAASKSPELLGRFVARDASGGQYVRVSPAVVEHALCQTWPSNVRGLEALLWSCVAESPGDTIELASALRSSIPSTPSPPVETRPAAEPTAEDVRQALQREDGSVTRAARALGLSSRYALYRLMKKHGLETSEGADSEG
ncbi:MAG: sigma 54-interacting transcriptional regulator [Polyangiaceae bacterium]